MKKLGKKLEELGISRARAIAIHKKSVTEGRAKLDVSGKSIPEYIGAAEMLDAPTGDAERVYFIARPTGEATGRGFVHEIVAVGRGPYGALVETVVGRTDADDMITPTEAP